MRVAQARHARPSLAPSNSAFLKSSPAPLSSVMAAECTGLRAPEGARYQIDEGGVRRVITTGVGAGAGDLGVQIGAWPPQGRR